MSTLPRRARPAGVYMPPIETPPSAATPPPATTTASNGRARQTSAAAVGETASPSSSIPKPSPSTSSIPTPSSATSSPNPAQTPRTPSQPVERRQLRKTMSYNSFSKAPNGTSQRSPPSSENTTPRSSARALPSTQPVSRSASFGKLAHVDSNSSLTREDSRGRDRHSSGSKDKGNVVISVRVKPEKDAKEDLASAREWHVDGRKSAIKFLGKEGGEYDYDNVFSANDKNGRVYDAAAKRLVRRVMEGYNGTVFAYGMTGTGKTYTMNGIATSPGVIPLAITDIFSFIRETPHREFLLRVSYLEIYNEKIHDLLTLPSSGVPTEEIKLREDSKGNVFATPLKEEIVQSPTQLLRVIARGEATRKVGQTQWNTHSSRSHAVVQIVVESRERNAGSTAVPDTVKKPLVPGGVRVSTLSLIDLAGSERAAETKERRTEGAHINKSLLTLGTVISKLSGNRDKQGQPTDTDGKHLPYRDSKLTRLLQPALAGNSLISILCTVQLGAAGSSAVGGTHTYETLNTLKFAARARNNIVSHAKRSEESHGGIGDAGSRALLDRYRAEIVDLRKQLDGKSVESSKTRAVEEERVKEEHERERHEEQLVEIHLARTALADRIEHLNRLILSSKSLGVNQARSFSSLSNAQRTSGLSNTTDTAARSLRSWASTQTLDAKSHNRASIDSSQTVMPGASGLYDEEEDVSPDGNATMGAQIRALQTDLADKSRFIEDLQRKLAQARRSSRSRTSLFLEQGRMKPIDFNMESLMREKDAEIAELKLKLEDKDKMLSALRSAARKREAVDALTPGATPGPTSPSELNGGFADRASVSTLSRQTSSASARSGLEKRHSSASSVYSLQRGASRGPSRGPSPSPMQSPISPSAAGLSWGPLSARSTPSIAARSPGALKTAPKRNHGVDEMTRMLDDMIRKKVDEDVAAARESGGLGGIAVPSRANGSMGDANNNASPGLGLGISTTNPHGRTNSLNLLAMRDVPAAAAAAASKRRATDNSGTRAAAADPAGNTPASPLSPAGSSPASPGAPSALAFSSSRRLKPSMLGTGFGLVQPGNRRIFSSPDELAGAQPSAREAGSTVNGSAVPAVNRNSNTSVAANRNSTASGSSGSSAATRAKGAAGSAAAAARATEALRTFRPMGTSNGAVPAPGSASTSPIARHAASPPPAYPIPPAPAQRDALMGTAL